jgi:phosphonatase-like hydrolase
MLPELIVFDLAGTTVKDNQDVHRVLQSALKQNGVMITLEEANVIMGTPKPVAIRKLLEDKQYPSIKDQFIEQIHNDFVREMISFYKTDVTVGEKEGVRKTFATLKRAGIKIAVDTGFDRQITDALLKRLGWVELNLIDTSVTSDEVENGRPYPDLIFEAMKRTGVKDVSRVAKVGDTASDMNEGTRAGCPWVVGVTTGSYSRENLQKEPHTHLIEQLPELLSILDLSRERAESFY